MQISRFLKNDINISLPYQDRFLTAKVRVHAGDSHAGFELKKMTLGQISPRGLRYPIVIYHSTMLNTNASAREGEIGQFEAVSPNS